MPEQAFQPQPSPPSRPPKITNQLISKVDVLRYDWIQIVGDGSFTDGPGAETVQTEHTVTWSTNASIGPVFDFATASFGGSYSEAMSFSQSFRLDLAAGQRARIVYIPNYTFINSVFTEQIWDPEDGWVTPADYDHVPITSWFPIEGGVFTLEFSQPTFYSELGYQGTRWVLDRGQYEAGPGSFDNYSISSMAAPKGYTVELFSEPNFQGRSIILTGGNWHFGDDWIRQTSSIKIW